LKKIRNQDNFSRQGFSEISELHARAMNNILLEIKDEYSETHLKYFVIRDTSLWLFKNWLEEQNFTNYHIWRCDTPEKDPGCFSKNYSLRISWQ